MTYVLEDAVKDEAGKLFQGTDLSSVIQMLEQTALPMERSGPPSRVHIAVLWLSKGSISKFSTELENAACDWRDTLVDAGLANENWREVLAGKGVDGSGWL